MTEVKEDIFTVEERNDTCEDFFRQCMEVLHQKGKDYNPHGDGFHTIKESADLLGANVPKVVFMLMNKHFASIRTFCANGHSESEHISGRLLDLANYCAILYAYLKLHNQLPPAPRMMSSRMFRDLVIRLQDLQSSIHNSSPEMIEKRNFILRNMEEVLQNWWSRGVDDETVTQTEKL